MIRAQSALSLSSSRQKSRDAEVWLNDLDDNGGQPAAPHRPGARLAGTTDVWLDDGPLASPDFFGGAWMPWRDENDLPYATYAILPGR